MLIGHIPVLLKEVLELLNLQNDGIYVDCTLGGGGHTQQILKKLGRQGLVVGIDQDPRTLAITKAKLSIYGERVKFVQGNFQHLKMYLNQLGIARVNGILFDLGVSSFQLDEGERGFSYQQDAVLDMRMDPQNPISAKDLVNQSSEDTLAQIIRDYGEERWARRIAKFIVAKRNQKPIKTTTELVEVIKDAIPASARRTGPHPARRTFQALRIAVNDELKVLQEALNQAIECLAPGGRLVVISFHSLEDRVVKDTFRQQANPCECPPDFPVCRCGKQPVLRIITRKPVLPSADELRINPRSRSARLRAAEKI
ncbi:MAG: 16S rRNA (cytosine(1402)-N(4))-methyltransferase RsmH [Syntrophomonadaceae bacterium]|nr:16S rRNA (cytosine(1402)-N(4))-methyltransferase RsmH [Syntrophomonadaceae bacterium]